MAGFTVLQHNGLVMGRQYVDPLDEYLLLSLKTSPSFNGTLDASNNVSQWNDESGNGNDFIQETGSLQPVFTDYNRVVFDRDNDNRLIAPANSDLNFDDDFTIRIKMKCPTYVNQGSALNTVFTRGSTTDTDWAIFLTSANKILFGIGTIKIVESDDVLSGETHDIFCMRENDTLKMYVDGILQSDTETYTNPLSNTFSIFLGSDIGSNRYSDIDVYELQIWNKALDESERTRILSGQTSTGGDAKPDIWITDKYNDLYTTSDYSGTTVVNTITNFGTDEVGLIQTTETNKMLKDGIGFKTADITDWMYQTQNLNMNYGMSDFSVSFWLKYTTTNRVFEIRGSDGTRMIFLLTSSYLGIYLVDSEGNTSNYGSAILYTSNSNWNHYAVTFNRTTNERNGYLNGEFSKTFDLTPFTGEFNFNTTFYLGYPSNVAYIGSINDLIIQKGLLDAAYIYHKQKYLYI
jgi:hypothetical protein